MSDARRVAAAARDEAPVPPRAAAAAGPTPPPTRGGGLGPGVPPTVSGAPAAVVPSMGAAAGGGGGDVPPEATPMPCPVPGCGVLLAGGVGAPTGRLHLRQAHVAAEVPAGVLSALGAAGCRWCERPFSVARGRSGKSSLSAHESQCRLNPRRQRTRAAPPRAATAAVATATTATLAVAAGVATTTVTAMAATPTAATTAETTVMATAAAGATGSAAATAAAAAAAAATGPTAAAGEGADATRFGTDHAAWVRARSAFLRAAAPTDAAWPALVASGARTAAHVPAALAGAWRRLFADALDWVWHEPTQRQAWLWLLTLPSLALHGPVRAADRRAGGDPPPVLSLAARAAALLEGDFAGALADRDAGIWRPPAGGGGGPGAPAKRPAERPAVPPATDSGARSAPRLTAAQRRALRQLRSGRLSAAARSLLAEPPAPKSPAVWRKACALFARAAPGLATAASVAAAFPADLEAAEAAAAASPAPAALSRAAVEAAIRSAGPGKSPGPSGLRVEHLWALAADGQDALVEVLLLLAGGPALPRVPAVATRALAGADLVLLTKPGGMQADGLPGLRPIGMPETLRKLVAAALARSVRGAAAALFAPLQMGVGVSSACERMLHELEAHLALHPHHALLQLDFRNAFNLVSRAAAWAVLSRALPVLSPYLEWVYGGEGGGAAPPVYGWAPGGADGGTAEGGGGERDVGAGGAGCEGGERLTARRVGRGGRNATRAGRCWPRRGGWCCRPSGAPSRVTR